MGIQIGFNPSAPNAGMGERFAGPGGQGVGMPSGYWGSNLPTSTPQGIGWQGYNPAVIAAGMPSVNTGNDNYVVPNFAPSQWGSFDMPTFNPTMGFNNQPYVENFNAGFPAQMNPAFNIDNITQPAPFTGYPNQTGIPPAAPWVNPNLSPQVSPQWGGPENMVSGPGEIGGGREGAGR